MQLQSVVSPLPPLGVPPVRLVFAGDEDLARRAGRGDDAAFRLLYERYHQPLYRYCRSLLRHEADAQDALQSAFASAFTALRRGRRDAPVRPWLFRIAHNESVSVLRRRRPEQELTDRSEPITASLEEHVEQRQRLALLLTDLRELSERQRGALVMRELSGLSHEEIALALDTSVNAAKQTIFEARRSLTEYAEGRAMACDDVCRLISDADGRVLRGRRVRAHLRHCPECAAFAAAIGERSMQLRALAPPLPAVAAGGIFARAVWGGSAHGGDSAGLLAAGAGKAAGTAIAAKVTAVVVAATAAVGVTAALRQPMPVSHPASPAHAAPAAQSSRAPASRAAAAESSASDPATTAAGARLVSPRRRGRHGPRASGEGKRAAVGGVVAAGTAGAAPTAAISLTPLGAGRGAAGNHRGASRHSSTGGVSSSPTRSHGASAEAGKSSPATRGDSGTSHGSWAGTNASGRGAGGAAHHAHPSPPIAPVGGGHSSSASAKTEHLVRTGR